MSPLSAAGRRPPCPQTVVSERYQSSDRRLVAVPITIASTLGIGTPATLFAISGSNWVDFDVTRDDQRFLAVIPEVVVNAAPLTALQNWNTPPR